MRRHWKTVSAMLVAVACTQMASAEKKYTLGAYMDLIFAVDDNPQVGEIGGFRPAEEGLTTTATFAPTFTLDVVGQRTSGQFFYSYGLNRFDTDTDLNFQSHTFGGSLQTALNNRLTFSLDESFTRAPDLSLATVLRGVRVTPEGIVFDLDTVSQRRNSYFNQTAVRFDYALSDLSGFEFGVSHGLRDYQESPTFDTTRSDQTTVEGFFRFRKQPTYKTRWNMEYSFRQNNFDEFENSRVHTPSAGLSYMFSSQFTVEVSAGPAYLEPLDGGVGQWGYNADLSLSRSGEYGEMSFSISHRVGTSTGVGSTSETDRLALSFSRMLFQPATLNVDLSVFDTQSQLDSPVDTRGLSALVSFDFLLSRHWSLSVAGSYFNQQGTDTFNLNRNRVFLTLRYSLPNLWRFSR